MYVISVIPLTRASTIETLSYYSSIEYIIGTLLQVPVRNAEVSGVVVATEPVGAARTALRAATFSLRKLPPQPEAGSLPSTLMKTAASLANTTPAPLGSILMALLPPDIRSGSRPYPFTKTYENIDVDTTPAILTETRHNRFLTYRSLIRQAFAHRGSVLFIVPTAAAANQAAALLKSGIEKRIVTFSSAANKRQLDTAYDGLTDFSTAKLIIATPSYAFLDRHDLTTIIIEESASTHYKTRTRPYLDLRNVFLNYAQVSKRSILFGDILPRTEEEVARRNELYSTYGEHPHRHNFSSTLTTVIHGPSVAKTIPIFTEELIAATKLTHENKGHIFFLAARRGLAPIVICSDCGHVFRCPDSGAPYRLIASNKQGSEERWFYSTPTGQRVRAADTCPDCGSWRLREQGIGIQRVVAEARKHFPHLPLTVFDHTTATTHNKAAKLIAQFRQERGGLLIATTMVLPYLTEPIEQTAVISYEALRTIPSWRAEESTLSTLLTLRDITANNCLIQLRSEPDPLLRHLERGFIDDFYDEEIEMRRTLNYPPFSIFILLTWQGDKTGVMATEELIQSRLATYDPHCYGSPLPGDKIIRHALLRIATKDWPDQKLMNLLRGLSPSIRIEVSPERII